MLAITESTSIIGEGTVEKFQVIIFRISNERAKSRQVIFHVYIKKKRKRYERVDIPREKEKACQGRWSRREGPARYCEKQFIDPGSSRAGTTDLDSWQISDR